MGASYSTTGPITCAPCSNRATGPSRTSPRPAPEALRREVELDQGARLQRVPHPPEGRGSTLPLLVRPSGSDRLGRDGQQLRVHLAAVDRLTREWLSAVDRDRTHPCIVTWVPINESWGVRACPGRSASAAPALALPPHQELRSHASGHLQRRLGACADRHRQHSRLLARGATLLERYGSEPPSTNLVQRPTATAAPHRGRSRPAPVMLTEFGGISFHPRPGKLDGLRHGHHAEEYLDILRDLFGAVCDCPDIAGFCYTQITDTEQEKNGLLRRATPSQVRHLRHPQHLRRRESDTSSCSEQIAGRGISRAISKVPGLSRARRLPLPPHPARAAHRRRPHPRQVARATGPVRGSTSRIRINLYAAVRF